MILLALLRDLRTSRLEDKALRLLTPGILDAAEEKVVAHVVAAAAARSDVTRVILFGSRASRGHRPRSDFDIAIQADRMSHLDWAVFASQLTESVPTLCGLDLIKIDDSVAQSLRDAITQTGLILYEK